MDRYCTQTIKVPFKNRIFHNTEVFVNLPKAGDAISKIRLITSDANPLKEELINEAELITNKVSIEKIYGEFIKIENQFIVKPELKKEYTRLSETYIDIPFWTVKNMLFDYETLRISFAASNNSNDEINAYLLVDYVVVENVPEKTETYFQNFRNIARLNIPSIDSVKRLEVTTYIPGSVFELWFTIKDQETGEYIQDQVLENLRLFIGSDERFNVSSTHLRFIEPLKIYKSYAQDFPVYVYSFRLKYSSNLPSGQTNLSGSQRFVFDFVNNASNYNLTIWAQYHDFYYKNGEKGIRSIFDSGELVLGTSSISCRTFDPIPDFKTSYTFYSDTAAIQYSSSTEIQTVTITDGPSKYTITQNEIIFNGLDSLNGTYSANVVFHSVGYSDVTCRYNFKSPKSFIDTNIGFFDTFYSGYPTFFVDGNQRLNAFSGTFLNGVDYSKQITNVIVDQYRNYILTFGDGTCSKPGISQPVTGIPSTYFDTYVIPCANLFYINSTIHTISNCVLYGSACTSDGSVYVSGTTTRTGPIVVDNSVTFSIGSGIKSFLYKNSAYCVIADNNNGPGLVSTNKNGPVFAFPVTSSTTLYSGSGTTFVYSSDGISVASISALSGSILWRYTINGSNLTLLKCLTDYFDNVYFSYRDSTKYYIVKLGGRDGSLKWSRQFTLLQKNDFVIEQDCTIVSYSAGLSNVLLVSDARSINVPAGLTGFDVLDSDGSLVTFYRTPTSNVSDFINKIKETYYTPLYGGSYFSNASDYNYNKTFRNFWGVFVNGTPSAETTTCDVNSINAVFTGQYGPASTNVFPSTSVILPSTDKSATFVSKINVSTGNPEWVTYIDNTVNRYIEYSVNITTTGNVYASGTYGKYRSNIYNADGTMFQGYLPLLGTNGVYLVKYNPDGQALWQTYMDGVGGTDRNYAIARKSSNTYITGFSDVGGVTLYNANLTGNRLPTSSGYSTTNKMFISNYDHNGQVQWLMSIPLAQPSLITTESTGNVLCAFNYFGGGSSQVVQSNGTNFSPVFSYWSALKFTPGGMGILGINITSGGDGRITSITSSPLDNSIYVAGRFPNFNQGINIYNWNGSGFTFATTFNPSRPIYSLDAYIVKYDTNGTFQWRASLLHLNNSSGQVIIQSIACDSNGNLIACGYYENATDVAAAFNSDDTQFTGAVLPGTGFGAGFGDSYVGGFLVKYNSSGVCQWLIRFDSSGTGFVGGISIAQDDTIVVTGSSYSKNIKFYDSNGGEHNSFQPISASQTFTYCVRYDTNGFLIPTNAHNVIAVSNYGDGSVNVYSINDSGVYTLRNRITGLSGPKGVSLSADASILSVSSNVYQKIGSTYSLIQTLNESSDCDTSLSADGKILAISGNVYSENPTGTYSFIRTLGGARSVSVSSDGTLIATLGSSYANVYYTSNGTLKQQITGYTNPTSISINQDGSLIAVCDQNAVKINSNTVVNISNPTDVHLTPDGRLLAVASSNGVANVYQITQGGTYTLITNIIGLNNPNGICIS